MAALPSACAKSLALAEIFGAARAACQVSIPAAKYVAAALSHLEIPTALTIEGHKAELHFAVSERVRFSAGLSVGMAHIQFFAGRGGGG